MTDPVTSSVSPTPTERLEAAAVVIEARATSSPDGSAYWQKQAAEDRAVAAWLRSEAKIRAMFVAFVELVVALSVERNDGLIDEMSLKRDGDGNLLFDADTSQHALAVADAVLGEQP